MSGPHTTAAVQLFLEQLKVHGEDSAAPIVRDLLGRAASRLHLLCSSLLHRSYPRLARPPLNLQADEMLSAVVERLMKALREVRPGNVRQFFALANQHMRWELNDLARRLDERPPPVSMAEEPAAPLPPNSSVAATPDLRRILAAIEGLPEEEREVFGLVRIQGLTHAEAASVLGVATKTVQRRINRGLLLLTEALGDLRSAPGAASSPASGE